MKVQPLSRKPAAISDMPTQAVRDQIVRHPTELNTGVFSENYGRFTENDRWQFNALHAQNKSIAISQK
jgi:hypothetical protein